MKILRRTVAARAVFAVGSLVAAFVALTPSSSYAEPTGDPKPVRVVVLVDESGSLSEDQVKAERNAASLIARSEFSPESEIAVVGFGSLNAPGQNAVDDFCELTRVDTESHLTYLTQCVQKLHARTKDQGNDTDFATALDDALGVLGADDTGQQKMIFLMTDGELDVKNSPSWGATPEQRNDNARQKMDGHLNEAARRNIQVWPLGFGTQINRAQLDGFAAKGAQTTCGPDAPKPSARVVTSDTDVADQLFQAFGAARCGKVSPPVRTQVGPGSTVNLTVEIPAVSTDGSIAVIKNDPRISVSFFEPGNDGKPVPKSGSANGSDFSASGENGAVEVLRIRNPRPGQWRVQLTSGPDVPLQRVGATVIWQGNVQSSITVSPPHPQAGQSVTVQLTVATPAGALTDPKALSFLHVGVELSGDGFDPIPVSMADDGKSPDRRAGDGTYSGAVAVPTTATNRITFAARIRGQGIADSGVPYPTTVAHGQPPVVAHIDLTPPDRVTPGSTVSGVAVVGNTSGQDTTVRVVLTPSGTALMRLTSPTSAVIPASGQVKIPIRVAFDEHTGLGPARFTVAVANNTNPSSDEYDKQQYTVRVGFPPPWWRRPPWTYVEVALAALAVLVLAMVVTRQVRRNNTRVVSGLVAVLYHEGRERTLTAPGQRSKQFRFVIRDMGTGNVRLDHPLASDQPYVLTRDGDGKVSVLTPHATRMFLRPGGREPIDEGLALGYRDERHVHVDSAPTRFDPNDQLGLSSHDSSVPDGRANWTAGDGSTSSYNDL